MFDVPFDIDTTNRPYNNMAICRKTNFSLALLCRDGGSSGEEDRGDPADNTYYNDTDEKTAQVCYRK